jgi:mRNA-degrading endonuclease RelE of RelBE toxin-antitoxin system
LSPEENRDIYEIRFSRRAEKGWKTLEENIPEATEKCLHFLMFTPLDRLASGGKIKKMKGTFSEFLQYDVTDNARIQYWVDKDCRIVYVKYAGPHP